MTIQLTQHVELILAAVCETVVGLSVRSFHGISLISRLYLFVPLQ